MEVSAVGVPGWACLGAAPSSRPSPSRACAPGIVGHVNPSRGLVDGQAVTVSGRGLAQGPTPEAPDLVRRRVHGLRPGTDESLHRHPALDVTEAKAIHLSRHDTFSIRFHVTTGIIGDGYCGSNGHDTCVISVGHAPGQGTVVHITFRDPAAPPPSSTTTTTTSTASTRRLRRRATIPGGCTR